MIEADGLLKCSPGLGWSSVLHFTRLTLPEVFNGVLSLVVNLVGPLENVSHLVRVQVTPEMMEFEHFFPPERSRAVNLSVALVMSYVGGDVPSRPLYDLGSVLLLLSADHHVDDLPKLLTCPVLGSNHLGDKMIFVVLRESHDHHVKVTRL